LGLYFLIYKAGSPVPDSVVALVVEWAEVSCLSGSLLSGAAMWDTGRF
jgi:hypothetical protein